MSGLTLGLDAIIKNLKVDAQALKDLGEKAAESIANNIQKASSNISSAEFRNNLSRNVTDMGKVLRGQDVEKMSPEQKQNAALTRTLSQGFEKLEGTFKGILTKSFDVLETIYGELRKASPLLQAVEQLFNLAMTLFFMPLGNKLGELLIPAVIKLVDNVMDIWDAFGGMTLGEMFEHAISAGINMLADFLNNIGDELIQQGGWIADLGELLKGLSSFVKNNLAGVIKTILDAVTWVVTHLGTMIGLIGTFMSLHYALQLATMAVIAAAAPGLSKVSAGLAFAAVATGAIGIGASWGIGKKIGLAEGGYVPATEGGQVHILGEGGEGEYVIPESKMGALGGNSYTINNYMMSTDELDRHIRDVVRGEVSASRLRSGF